MLFRTSSTGPRPTGGSSPVRVVSCSSTSQRSYPWWSSTRPPRQSMRRRRPAAGTGPAAWLRRATAPPSEPLGEPRVHVLQVHVDDPLGMTSRELHGSAPPIARWPVSRHQSGSPCSRTASMSSAVSTSVPAWGGARAGGRSAACSRLSRLLPEAPPSRPRAARAETRRGRSRRRPRGPPRRGRSSAASPRQHRAGRSSERSCSTIGTNAPTRPRPWRASRARTRSGSGGR